jgi:predicted metalloprotease with PDZ domain
LAPHASGSRRDPSWAAGVCITVGGRTASRGAAPPIELRAEAGAVSGAGSSFLLLPPADWSAHLTVRWDLSALAQGATGVSSFGLGDVAQKVPQPITRLERSYFMAGPIGHYARGSFFAAWQGTPPFDAGALMVWTGRLYGHYVAFFRPPQVQPYGVFLRPNPVNAGGGFGLARSFIVTFGSRTDPEQLKLTLAHEMFHTFAPSIVRPAGLESSWFGEGLAVFYARTLALRFGQIGPKAFLDDLNGTAARYYTSVMAGVPNREVPARFWADTRIRTLPYDRGALYFAAVDDTMRKASSGRRSLDDLMLAMLKLERGGRMLSNADWEDLLRQNLGERRVADFRAMLAGREPLPASDAFGPCFRRTMRPLRRYELGFEPAVLTEPHRIVRGLVAGSAADQAGLRNGDEILYPVPQDAIQGSQKQLLTLEIRRDGRTFQITYLPRGETVQTWQWDRVPGVPNARCAR